LFFASKLASVLKEHSNKKGKVSMPFNGERAVQLDVFMVGLQKKMREGENTNALTFFELFLKNALPNEVRRQAAKGWDGLVNAGDFDVIYPMAARTLLDAATTNASEVHPDTYKDASTVSQAFADELNDVFQCSGDDRFEFLPIKSYSQMMAEAGVVDLSRDSDGQTTISLTPKGKELARQVREEIQRLRA